VWCDGLTGPRFAVRPMKPPGLGFDGTEYETS
jgi:hypothetical protein